MRIFNTTPKKWAILRTVENSADVNKYINNKWNHTYYRNYDYMNCDEDARLGVTVRERVLDGYTELTYEEFKAYILRLKSPEEIEAENQKIMQERINREMKGLYRQRLKQLNDEVVELKYEREKLYKEIEELTKTANNDSRPNVS